MPNQIVLTSDALVNVLAQSLEVMAFISLVPAEPPFVIPAEPVLVKIEFSGPMRGSLEMMAPRELGRVLVANVTGEAGDCPAIQSDDALRELMNVVCGVLLRSEQGVSQYEISLPTLTLIESDSHWKALLSDTAVSVVDVEGMHVAIRHVLLI